MDKTQIADQIMNIVNQIAKKLGVAAEKVYPILIKQAYVEGVSMIVFLLLTLTISVISWILLSKGIKKNWDEVIIGLCFFIGIITTLIFSVTLICGFKNIITAFINPDWYVFNTLLKNLIN